MMAVTSRSGEEGGVKREGSAVDEYRSPPSRVTFPDAALRMSGSSTTPPLLKLQVEESSESMNPNNMWQKTWRLLAVKLRSMHSLGDSLPPQIHAQFMFS
ncbi:uncharacterized protein LOC120261734 isoform X3 [Dioscorea cayenensis subsp. rotundata]|uniref:Uncharacterized protein LOC120261734 isoform X3 n=1 Tax=Dioscorea cayennensis subsp. rotundata TaxID=55577 RepID=A0AB40BE79_DIOCR|nr:uncharacterized protein LOC120261734 isoform X3 [Dioscorea cayenensis subsp. rotundata]